MQYVYVQNIYDSIKYDKNKSKLFNSAYYNWTLFFLVIIIKFKSLTWRTFCEYSNSSRINMWRKRLIEVRFLFKYCGQHCWWHPGTYTCTNNTTLNYNSSPHSLWWAPTHHYSSVTARPSPTPKSNLAAPFLNLEQKL